MTALREYDRLECGGLWRADSDAQRREVMVNFGNATLIIADTAGRPLTHWSLPAVVRQNAGTMPAIFAPSEKDEESLEIDDTSMIDAIEKVLKSVQKSRPKPGKLRSALTLGVIVGIAVISVFWLPGALMRQTMSVVPMAKRAEIGAVVLGHVQRLTGPRCQNSDGTAALEVLRKRLLGPQAEGQIVVLPKLDQGAVALTGGLILLDKRLIENAQDPAVTAGYIIAAAQERSKTDPLAAVLRSVGMGRTMGLLTTGELAPEDLEPYARALTEAKPSFPSNRVLINAFTAAQIPTGPFAYARDAAGKNTAALIANDPYAERDEPEILDDAGWVRLQGVCNG